MSISHYTTGMYYMYLSFLVFADTYEALANALTALNSCLGRDLMKLRIFPFTPNVLYAVRSSLSFEILAELTPKISNHSTGSGSSGLV